MRERDSQPQRIDLARLTFDSHAGDHGIGRINRNRAKRLQTPARRRPKMERFASHGPGDGNHRVVVSDDAINRQTYKGSVRRLARLHRQAGLLVRWCRLAVRCLDRRYIRKQGDSEQSNESHRSKIHSAVAARATRLILAGTNISWT